MFHFKYIDLDGVNTGYINDVQISPSTPSKNPIGIYCGLMSSCSYYNYFNDKSKTLTKRLERMDRYLRINEREKVRVYRNLRNGMWSVVQAGIVNCHVSHLWLKNAKMIVSESGRQRVIRERRKNVHAYIEGELVESFPYIDGRCNTRLAPSITYNPYKAATFICNKKPIYKSNTLYFSKNVIYNHDDHIIV